jgi:hypothetical protein
VSKEKVEIIRGLLDVLNLHEPTEEDFAPWVTPDYDVQNVRTEVTDKTYRGTVGILQWRNRPIDVFAEDVRFEGDVVADGSDFVVVRMAVVGRDASSGAPLTLRFAGVHWFEDRSIRHTVGHARVSGALDAAGLEE